MSEPFEMNITQEKPSTPCLCGYSNWWQRKDGVWICVICHPNPLIDESEGFRKSYTLDIQSSRGTKK